MSEEESGRQVPTNSLDLEYMLTDNDWGKDVPPELKQALTRTKIIKVLNTDTGKISYDYEEKNLWQLLAFYNKELRLANINLIELQFCQFWIDLAGDLLSDDMPLSFLTALRRAITVLELSQSKAGFLRIRQQTITTEEKKIEEKAQDQGFSLDNFKRRFIR